VKKAKEHELKTAIVTTIARFKFQKALQSLLPYLDTIVTGYETRCEKSNPKMFRRTLEILNVKPSEAVMIGDDVPIDILISKRLGIRTILLDREHRMGDSQYPDAVAENLIEAMRMVEAWIRR